MPAFHPLADAVASALRTLVLLGVLAAVAGVPAAVVASRRGAGSPNWLVGLAGPAVTIHGLNLLFFLVLSAWMAVDTLRGAGAPSAGQWLLFVASFLVPNLGGAWAWIHVCRRRRLGDPVSVVPRQEDAEPR